MSDYDEVAYDGDPNVYTPGADLNPLSTDTDGDGLPDGSDPLPITFNYADGDVAPLGAPDGVTDGADYVVVQRFVLGDAIPGNLELAHGDVYPPGAPDGVIDLSDLILILNSVN